MGMPEDRLPEFVKLSEVFMRSNDEAERAQNIQQIYGVIAEYLAWRATRPGGWSSVWQSNGKVLRARSTSTKRKGGFSSWQCRRYRPRSKVRGRGSGHRV